MSEIEWALLRYVPARHRVGWCKSCEFNFYRHPDDTQINLCRRCTYPWETIHEENRCGWADYGTDDCERLALTSWGVDGTPTCLYHLAKQFTP